MRPLLFHMSGWTTITAKAQDGKEDELLTAFEDAADDHGGEHDGRATEGRDGIVTLYLHGYSNHGKAKKILKQHTDKWGKASVIDANDTSDSGEGTAYESDGSSIKALDSAAGHEGAMAHDVAGELRGALGFKPRVR